MPVILHLQRSLRRSFIRMVVLVFLVSAAVSGVLAAQVDQAAEGEKLFQQYCIGCHTIGQGNTVGPDLNGVTSRRDYQWLIDWITAPDKVLARGDPIAQELVQQFPLVMPNLGLTPDQARLIIAYLEAQSGATPSAATPAVVAALPPGDVVRGKDLFTGRTRFSGGGPACMACHSVGGLGALGGGQLGPDLTMSVSKYGGEAGLTAFLANPPTQTMNVVWGAQPLTPQEQADLVAFLSQAPVTGRPADKVLQLAVIAVIGTALLFVVAHLTWRRRLGRVRRSMVLVSRR